MRELLLSYMEASRDDVWVVLDDNESDGVESSDLGKQ